MLVSVVQRSEEDPKEFTKNSLRVYYLLVIHQSMILISEFIKIADKKSLQKINCISTLLLLFFSRPVISDCLQPHGLQNSRPPYPLSSPVVCPIWCPLHRWWHLSILSSDDLFSFCCQFFPASGLFQWSAICIKGWKYWSFSISLSNEYSGLISL